MKSIISPILLLATTLSSFTQVNSTEVNQTLNGVSSINIDINNDEQNDFTFEIIELSANNYAARVISLNNSEILDNSTFGYPDATEFGDDISGDFENGNGVLGTSVGNGGLFNGAGDRYLGISIEISGLTYYGWVELNCNAQNSNLIIKSYGYNTVADETITAGQSLSTSIISQEQKQELKTFPNPVENLLHIEKNTSESITIFDLSGVSILESQEKVVDVSKLKIGIYIIQCGNKKTRFVKI